MAVLLTRESRDAASRAGMHLIEKGPKVDATLSIESSVNVQPRWRSSGEEWKESSRSREHEELMGLLEGVVVPGRRDRTDKRPVVRLSRSAGLTGLGCFLVAWWCGVLSGVPFLLSAVAINPMRNLSKCGRVLFGLVWSGLDCRAGCCLFTPVFSSLSLSLSLFSVLGSPSTARMRDTGVPNLQQISQICPK